MQIKRIDFIAPVNFGGTLKSISTTVSGARPGETPAKLDMDEDMRFVSLTKHVNGVESVKIVPMTNVSGMDIIADEPKPVEAKKAK
jgi:hypothetical protein